MESILNIFFNNGYNLVNTTIYTLVIFLAYLLFYKLLKKRYPTIEINNKFIYSVLPFVLLGSLLRIFEQDYTGLNLIKYSNSPLNIGFYFHTPGWLILISFIFIFCFFLSLKVLKEKYYKLLISLGFFFSIPLLVYEVFHFSNFLILIIALSLMAFTYFLIKLLRYTKISIFKKLNTLENKLIILSQITDSFATLVGLSFFKVNLYEQHPVSRLVISICPFLFLLLKLSFAFLFIVVVDKYIKDKEKNSYIKLLIVILGFLTGLRDLLTISLLRI